MTSVFREAKRKASKRKNIITDSEDDASGKSDQEGKSDKEGEVSDSQAKKKEEAR